MQNLKIRVNSADESKEAQELLFELGATLGNGDRHAVMVTGAIGLAVIDGLINFVFNQVVHSDITQAKEITLPELRAMVNQEQDEPFLTPECTLNDQYAEIEQVRQQTIDVTLAERQSQYGCYEDVAHVTQQILSVLRVGNYDELPAPMKESLHMIASKMARIVNGDPEYLDNWHDIGGYAKLIEKLIEGI